jgi:hypothetical protein
MALIQSYGEQVIKGAFSKTPGQILFLGIARTRTLYAALQLRSKKREQQVDEPSSPAHSLNGGALADLQHLKCNLCMAFDHRTSIHIHTTSRQSQLIFGRLQSQKPDKKWTADEKTVRLIPGRSQPNL